MRSSGDRSGNVDTPSKRRHGKPLSSPYAKISLFQRRTPVTPLSCNFDVDNSITQTTRRDYQFSRLILPAASAPKMGLYLAHPISLNSSKHASLLLSLYSCSSISPHLPYGPNTNLCLLCHGASPFANSIHFSRNTVPTLFAAGLCDVSKPPNSIKRSTAWCARLEGCQGLGSSKRNL